MKKVLCFLIIFSVIIGALLGCNGLNSTPGQPFESTEQSITGSASDISVKPTKAPIQTPTDAPEVTLTPKAPITPDIPIGTTATLKEDGSYTSKEDVGLYIHQYGRLPENFVTKQEARKLGWNGGSVESYAPGHCIGGDRFVNYEGLLPEKDGRFYTECDIDTLGASSRGAKRIVFSNDGLVYYTDDHYESFILLYGEEEQ